VTGAVLLLTLTLPSAPLLLLRAALRLRLWRERWCVRCVMAGGCCLMRSTWHLLRCWSASQVRVGWGGGVVGVLVLGMGVLGVLGRGRGRTDQLTRRLTAAGMLCGCSLQAYRRVHSLAPLPLSLLLTPSSLCDRYPGVLPTRWQQHSSGRKQPNSSSSSSCRLVQWSAAGGAR
jgi:hypothetical protein